jgi:CBS-domain-containing membrane protein
MSRKSRRKMSRAQVRRLPVIDENEKLCGIVSLGDLSRETEGETAHQALEGVSAPRRPAQAGLVASASRVR